ncbi:hypothetical protein Sjap_024432 [Stephania japonica]|uniref:Uncharacterized protein n=1 Tax=Stephania japonica TaxID=461633 RepID=A0AAP0EDD6_9MAGN
MDSEKRKRQANGADNGRRTKARDEEEGTEKVTVTVAEKTDEEVEEFFAILRRLHSAVRDYKRDGPAGNGNGNNEPNGDVRHELWKRPTWKPSFEWGDFEGVNGAVTSRPQEEEEEEGYVLDLNADPKS